jgi:hypothetical protein
MCYTPGAQARIRWQTAMQKDQIQVHRQRGWMGCVGGRPQKGLSQDGHECNLGGTQTAEADDPPVVVMSSRSSHVQSWRPARCPRFRLISRPLCRREKTGAPVVPGPKYGNSQQVGSCWGRPFGGMGADRDHQPDTDALGHLHHHHHREPQLNGY